DSDAVARREMLAHRRNRFGRVAAPARIWLTAQEECYRHPSDKDACLAVPTEWLAKLQAGETIKFLDARGLSRSMVIKEISESGCWAESGKTAYVVCGTLLQVMRAENGKVISAEIARIGNLLPESQPIRLKIGDILIMQAKSDP